MSRTYTPTRAADLKAGDQFNNYTERVERDAVACESHIGNVFFEESDPIKGTHSDWCVEPDMIFVVRKEN